MEHKDEYEYREGYNEYLMDDHNGTKWYDKGFAVWLLLILLPIVGIPFMWIKKKSYSRVKKIILTIIFVQWVGVVPIFVFLCADSFITDYEETSGGTKQMEITEEVEEIVGAKETESQTMGEKNALGRAEYSLGNWCYSKQSLMEELEYDGFTAEEIAYAMEHLDVDWMEEAAIYAQTDVETYYFSKVGILQDLEWAGFTEEEVAYGLAAVGY